MPVLLLDDVDQTHWVAAASLSAAAESPTEHRRASATGIDPFVQETVAGTNGILYKQAIGRLTRYPIPSLRLSPSNGQTFLDIGCNWGRWTISAARLGYSAVGIDPSLDAVLAARRVARQLGFAATFIVGDARFLPFASSAFDIAFSYSVIQHLSKDNARIAIAETGRVIKPGGTSLIQMPNRYGIRSLYHLIHRGFAEGKDFDVRYWTPHELRQTFDSAIGPSSLSVDGFFGLGIQPSDLDLMPLKYRVVIRASEMLRLLARRTPVLTSVADSLYVTSTKTAQQVEVEAPV